MTPIVRALRWPDDRNALEAIDVSFETDTIYAVTRTAPLGVAIVERGAPVLAGNCWRMRVPPLRPLLRIRRS
jgi:hypothetical protein